MAPVPSVTRLSFVASCFAAACLTLSGCGIGVSAPLAAATPESSSFGVTKGTVYGGEQPIGGSHIHLFSTGVAGYGSASASLVTAITADGTDTAGPYILADSGGNFTLTGRYLCTAGTQVYLYATGGNTGAGNNTAAALIGALGTCPASATLATSLNFVVVNELTTIAFVYSLNAYIVDALHVGTSSTTQGALGLSNAVALATTLVAPNTGRAAFNTNQSNFQVQQLDTLANILAGCVNSQGPTFPVCTTLLATATSDGTTAGTHPTDTVAAAINIARNPTANVSTLYFLASSTPPFTPIYSGPPHDYSLVIYGQLPTDNNQAANKSIAIDSQGNAWITNGRVGIFKFSNTGAMLVSLPTVSATADAVDTNDNVWTASGYSSALGEYSSTGTSLLANVNIPAGYPSGLAIDGSNNLWFSDSSTYRIERLSPTLTVTACCSYHDTAAGTYFPQGIAIDSNGNAWAADGYAGIGGRGALEEVSPGVALLSPATTNGYPGGGVQYAGPPAIDAANNVWTASNGTSTVVPFSNAGVALSTTGYGGGGLSGPNYIAIDGLGNVFVTDSTQYVKEFSNSGTLLSGPAGVNSGSVVPVAIAIDLSGNIWIANSGSQFQIQIGAGAPVVTPLSVGIKNAKLGTRP